MRNWRVNQDRKVVLLGSFLHHPFCRRHRAKKEPERSIQACRTTTRILLKSLSWLFRNAQRNKPIPAWFRPGDPSCVWEGVNQQEVTQEDPEAETEHQTQETEREPRLLRWFPRCLWIENDGPQVSSIQ